MARLRRPAGDVIRPDRSQTLQVVSQIVVDAPPPPTGLLDTTREAWAAFWGSDVARLVDPAVDGPALARLFELYDEVERAKRTFVEEGRYTTGSTGQAVISLAVKTWLALQKLIGPLEDRFGITPRGRLALGIKLGDVAASLERLNAAEPDADGWDDPRLIDAPE